MIYRTRLFSCRRRSPSCLIIFAPQSGRFQPSKWSVSPLKMMTIPANVMAERWKLQACRPRPRLQISSQNGGSPPASEPSPFCVLPNLHTFAFASFGAWWKRAAPPLLPIFPFLLIVQNLLPRVSPPPCPRRVGRLFPAAQHGSPSCRRKGRR